MRRVAAVLHAVAFTPFPNRLFGRAVALGQSPGKFIAGLERGAQLWRGRRFFMQPDVHQSLHPVQPQEPNVP